jgi:hypothetical protein
MVVPTVFGRAGDTLYLHGSVASRSLVSSPQATRVLDILKSMIPPRTGPGVS